MSIFTVERRARVAAEIAAFTERCEHIVALVAVGSGAYGYNDELSDLDFVVALDCDESMDAAMDYVCSRLRERYGIIYIKKAPQRRMLVCVLDDFLEIDVGFGAYTGAAAFRKDWRVIFDKSGTVDEAMRRSWERIKSAPQADAYDNMLTECADIVWHRFMQCAVAIKRDQPMRALAELESARSMYIGLLGRRFSLDTGGGKDTDKLPAAELTRLQKTYPAGIAPDALSVSLDALIDAVYTELERGGERSHMQIDRAQATDYVTACRRIRENA